jgi:hypothetical protein
MASTPAKPPPRDREGQQRSALGRVLLEVGGLQAPEDVGRAGGRRRQGSLASGRARRTPGGRGTSARRRGRARRGRTQLELAAGRADATVRACRSTPWARPRTIRVRGHAARSGAAMCRASRAPPRTSRASG